MTDLLFFDTDCLSAFLWVRNECLLPQLYPGKVVIPKPVYTELCRPNTTHLKKRVDVLLGQKVWRNCCEQQLAGHSGIHIGIWSQTYNHQ